MQLKEGNMQTYARRATVQKNENCNWYEEGKEEMDKCHNILWYHIRCCYPMHFFLVSCSLHICF